MVDAVGGRDLAGTTDVTGLLMVGVAAGDPLAAQLPRRSWGRARGDREERRSE